MSAADDFAHQVLSMPPDALDALHDASTRLSRTTTWATYRAMRDLRPSPIRADGTLTRHGHRVQGWLHDNRYTPAHSACDLCGVR